MRGTPRLVAALSASALALGVLATPSPAPAAGLGTEVLRGAAIGVAVKLAAKPLNDFINTVTLRNGKGTSLSTKVVPILSVGEKGYVGAAQVAGPKALVDKTQAVFEFEKNFSTNNYRAKVYLPGGSLNPLQFRRVEKVGVCALIDVSLDGAWRGQSLGKSITAGDAIRGAAVLAAVKLAAPTINSAINTITFNKGYATKVVPMGSIGEKAYLGGAQVSASALSIGKVKAVWQYEDLFGDGRFRVRVVLPVSALNPLEAKRVDGAGLTAVVDMALARQETPEARARRNDPLGGLLPGLDGRSDDAAYGTGDDERHDNGLHKGWYKGKHKGWKKDRD